jgi:hypothetical protein
MHDEEATIVARVVVMMSDDVESALFSTTFDFVCVLCAFLRLNAFLTFDFVCACLLRSTSFSRMTPHLRGATQRVRGRIDRRTAVLSAVGRAAAA